MTPTTDLIARLRAKDAEWQAQCDGWIAQAELANGKPLDAETIAILRRNSYGEAADALTTQEADRASWRRVAERLETEKQAAEAELARLREALEDAEAVATYAAKATRLTPAALRQLTVEASAFLRAARALSGADKP